MKLVTNSHEGGDGSTSRCEQIYINVVTNAHNDDD